ncbi:MAG: VPLPA-CTERM sorting domain-containing protein [Pseudomonadota bacterium]
MLRSQKYLFVLAAALSFVATLGSAATFTYDLHDHPGASKTAEHDYGLRLDEWGQFFSFGNGASAQLVYDDAAGTAVISGSVRESLGLSGGSKTFGGLWTLSYTMTGLSDLGGGFFKDFVGGSGSLTDGTTTRVLGAAANRAGEYFIFDANGHRISDPNGITGHGWVGKNGGYNDFLLTATIAPVPLPAAAWLLIGALAGLFGLRRRT